MASKQRFNEICREAGTRGVDQVVEWVAEELDRLGTGSQEKKVPAKKKGAK